MVSAFSYSLDNDKKFAAALARARATWDDLRIPFTLILGDFYGSEQAIFALKTPGQYPDFKGHRSKKTGKTAYQARKIKKAGFDYPLLVRTGRLAASLLGPSADGSIAVIGSQTLLIGTSIEYGVFHQLGGPKIPLRKFLFIGPEAGRFAIGDTKGRAERWLNIMNDFSLKGLTRDGALKRG